MLNPYRCNVDHGCAHPRQHRSRRWRRSHSCQAPAPAKPRREAAETTGRSRWRNGRGASGRRCCGAGRGDGRRRGGAGMVARRERSLRDCGVAGLERPVVGAARPTAERRRARGAWRAGRAGTRGRETGEGGIGLWIPWLWLFARISNTRSYLDFISFEER